MITGDVGTGKTILVDYLLSLIDAEHYLTSKLVTTQMGPDDTLRMVASGFGLDLTGSQKSTIIRQLEKFFTEVRRRRISPVIIVDEVQNLPRASLEELRMLSNCRGEDTPLVQTFLLGQTQFRDVLARGRSKQLKQRVVASSHLRPLSVEEMRGYVEHRLHTVGCGQPSPFQRGVLQQGDGRHTASDQYGFRPPPAGVRRRAPRNRRRPGRDRS